MELLREKHTRRIVYSFSIVTIYLLLTFIQENLLLDFFITLNLFYFSREVLYKELFTIPDTQVVTVVPAEHVVLTTSEAEVLPDNIKQLFQKSYTKTVTAASFNITNNASSEPETRLLTAMQKAEQLITEKIAQLQAKQSYKKTDVSDAQKVLKEELVQKIPEIEPEVEQEEIWETWNPLTINDNLLRQDIYCVKCQQMNKVQDMNYEIKTEKDYFEVVTIHNKESEQHVNTTRMTKESFEILSKPILTVKPLPAQPVAQGVKA